MKKIITYQCSVCGKESNNYSEIYNCELKHLQLSAEELKEWKILKAECRRKGQLIYYCKNETTENDFDKVISDLVKFEETHNLNGKNIPALM